MCSSDLALGLSRAVSQIHMVKWVRVILDGAQPDADLQRCTKAFEVRIYSCFQTQGRQRKMPSKYTEPWVLGFEFSRPEPFFSAGQADFEPSHDIYRHPERQGQPQELFKKIHDIYALGVILLEIGLWEPAIRLERNMFAHTGNAYAVQPQLIKHAQKSLESRVGRKYKVDIKFLTGSFGVEDDTRDDLKLQQAFRTQVVDVIEMAANYV